MADSTVRIGLNAHLLSLGASYRGAGISWYIYNLLTHLAQESPELWQYRVFLNEQTFEAPQLIRHLSRWPTQRPAVRILWEQLVQPLVLRQARVDLLHAMAFVGPVVSPCPYVVTVYDLSFLRFPQAFKPFNRWYLSHFTARSVREAKAVIAISESTRQDVINLLGVAPEKVHTIYCGADDTFKPLPPAEVEAFRTAQKLPTEFVLYLGTIEPRKNVTGLIRAYARWRSFDKNVPPLVIAGGKGWYYHQVFELVQTLKLTEHVRFPGYVPQSELPLWYNAATLFVYPSRFEGFGLPVLEAMACGTPVITSNVSSLPEVGGTDGTTYLIDPHWPEALAQALAILMNQPQRRQTMSERGLRRAAQFRWATTARQTVDVYKGVL